MSGPKKVSRPVPFAVNVPVSTNDGTSRFEEIVNEPAMSCVGSAVTRIQSLKCVVVTETVRAAGSRVTPGACTQKPRSSW